MVKRSYYSNDIQSFLNQDNYSIFGEKQRMTSFLLRTYKRILGIEKLKF